MSRIIVTDQGFSPDTWPAQGVCDLAGETSPDRLPGLAGITHIRITFSGFADGRGFTLARALRQKGYAGRLRATGLISDQYTMARRCGFDEVELSEALAARQPEAEWQARADWQAPSYLARLKA